MEEIDDYNEQLLQVCDEIEGGLAKIAEHKKGAPAIRDLQDRYKWAKQLFVSYKVELRELTKAQSTMYAQKTKDHDARLKKIGADLNWAQQEQQRQELGANGGGPGPSGQMSNTQMIAEADKIQGESLDSLARQKQMIQKTTQVGTEINTTLKQQTEQLERIGNDINTTESNLNKADRQIRVFMRRMMTDKIILCFLVLIVLGIIGAFIYNAVAPDGEEKTNVPEDSKPDFRL